MKACKDSRAKKLNAHIQEKSTHTPLIRSCFKYFINMKLASFYILPQESGLMFAARLCRKVAWSFKDIEFGKRKGQINHFSCLDSINPNAHMLFFR